MILYNYPLAGHAFGIVIKVLLGMTWAPATRVGDQDGISGSWLQPRSGMAIATIREVSQQIEDNTLSHPFSL